MDAFEINFSCPHGMPERKMGMAMGQVGGWAQLRGRWIRILDISSSMPSGTPPPQPCMCLPGLSQPVCPHSRRSAHPLACPLACP